MLDSLMSGSMNKNYMPKKSSGGGSASSAPVNTQVSGVYWVGQDGNIWYSRDGKGAQNMGRALNTYGNGFDGASGSAQAWQINDPNPGNGGGGGGSAPRAPGGGGGSGVVRPDNTAAINNSLKSIGALDTELNTGYGNIDNEYNSITTRYNNERDRTQRDFDENTFTNESNLQKNNQTALAGAAQGRRGLFGVLSSLGALGGTGLDLANRAVRDTANIDLGGAKDNYDTNTTNLTRAKRTFDEEDTDRRLELDTQRNNQRTALEGSVMSKRQSALQKLAELYAEMGNMGAASQRLNEAGDLSQGIASKTAVQATPYSRRTATFNPGELGTYAAGSGDMTVKTSGGSQGEGVLPSLSSLTARRREEERV